MSVSVLNYVWKNSKQKGTSLLVLLALADFANDEGDNAYPSVATLAHKARTTRRNVQLILRQLEEDGEIETRLNAGMHGSNSYRIILNEDTKGERKDFAPENISPRKNEQKGAKPTTPNPSYNHQEKKLKKEAAPNLSITLDENYKFLNISEGQVKRWAQAYPAVNIMAEIAKAELWLMANPKNTKYNYLRFLTNWFNRAQDKAPRVGSQAPARQIPDADDWMGRLS